MTNECPLRRSKSRIVEVACQGCKTAPDCAYVAARAYYYFGIRIPQEGHALENIVDRQTEATSFTVRELFQFINFAGETITRLAPDQSLPFQAGDYPTRRLCGDSEYRGHVFP